jgi:hypothetical protein
MNEDNIQTIKQIPISEQMKEMGFWPCRFCCNRKWDAYHGPQEKVCPKTKKSRKRAEIKDKNK